MRHSPRGALWALGQAWVLTSENDVEALYRPGCALYNAACVPLALMGYLLYLNWKLTLLTFVIAPPIMFVVATVSRRLRAMSQGAQEAMGDLNQVLNETTAGIKVVKVFGGQAYEDGRFAEQAAKVLAREI